MAGITGASTTFNHPELRGTLYHVTPTETPLLTRLGGLNGGKITDSIQWGWTLDDNPAASQPAILEGVPPVYSSRVPTQVTNVVQSFQEGFSVTYKSAAATGSYDSTAPNNNQPNPIASKIAHQTMLKMKKIARDMEYTLINGSYNVPSDNNAAYQTRGALEAITTNAEAAGGATLSKAMIDDVIKSMVDNGASAELGNLLVMCNSHNKQKFSSIYAISPRDRTTGGAAIDTVMTDFGFLDIVYDRYVPQDTVLFIDTSVCSTVFMQVPGQPTLMVEPLAKRGTSWEFQLYCEMGFEYGPEQWHGKITGTATS